MGFLSRAKYSEQGGRQKTNLMEFIKTQLSLFHLDKLKLQGALTLVKGQSLPYQANVVLQNPQTYPPDVGLLPLEVGLPNVQSNCYIAAYYGRNAVLQCLMRLGEFIQSLRQWPSQTEFTQLVTTISDRLQRRQQVPPDLILRFKQVFELNYPQFAGSLQQDSSEFLTCLLEMMHSECNLNQSLKAEPFAAQREIDFKICQYLTVMESNCASPVLKHFAIVYLIVSKCAECQTQRFRIGHTLCLDLALPKDQSKPKLSNLLRDNMSGTVKYECSKCGRAREHLEATKYIKLPKYLIISLKRYKKLGRLDRLFSKSTYKKDQKSIEIEIQINFVGRMYMDSLQPEYYLKAFTHHKGTDGSGHYTAYSFDSQWHFFNDLSTQYCPVEVVKNILRNDTGGYNYIYQQY